LLIFKFYRTHFAQLVFLCVFIALGKKFRFQNFEWFITQSIQNSYTEIDATDTAYRPESFSFHPTIFAPFPIYIKLKTILHYRTAAVRFVPKIEADELTARQLEMNYHVKLPRSVNT